MIPQTHFLIVGAILFSIGVFGALTRRNAIGILMSVELILNAANINLIAFNHPVFALLVIATAAASAVVGLVLVIAVYRHKTTVFIDEVNLLKW